MINQRLSLVIPRVFPQWVDEAKIIKIFRDQQIGIIFKVSIVRMPYEKNTSVNGRSEKSRSYPIYKAYLYFSAWFENVIAENFQSRIYGKDKQARVVYDDPWFWTVFENTERSKLSKADKRLLRLTREIYKNNQFVQKQQEELARELEEQKQKLEEQNNSIQILQDFCIQNGLEVPFWSKSHPPSVEVSSLEALSAATAVASADFVLADHDEAVDAQMDYYAIPYECAESVLRANEVDADEVDADEVDADEVDADEVDADEAGTKYEEQFNYEFIPVNSYNADWNFENPYINNTAEQSRFCSYLGREFEMEPHMSIPLLYV
jgi:hypothetical protein